MRYPKPWPSSLFVPCVETVDSPACNRFTCSSDIPTPLSFTAILMFLLSIHDKMDMQPPSCVNLMALPNRFRMTASSMRGSANAKWVRRMSVVSDMFFFPMTLERRSDTFRMTDCTSTSDGWQVMSSFLDCAQSNIFSISFCSVFAESYVLLVMRRRSDSFIASDSLERFSNAPTMANIGFFRSWATTEMSRSLSVRASFSSEVRSFTFCSNSFLACINRLIRRRMMPPTIMVRTMANNNLNHKVSHHGGNTLMVKLICLGTHSTLFRNASMVNWYSPAGKWENWTNLPPETSVHSCFKSLSL